MTDLLTFHSCNCFPCTCIYAGFSIEFVIHYFFFLSESSSPIWKFRILLFSSSPWYFITPGFCWNIYVSVFFSVCLFHFTNSYLVTILYIIFPHNRFRFNYIYWKILYLQFPTHLILPRIEISVSPHLAFNVLPQVISSSECLINICSPILCIFRTFFDPIGEWYLGWQ